MRHNMGGALVLMCFFIFLPRVFSAENSLTLTTYYPAPAGSYVAMRATKMCVGTKCHDKTAAALENQLYVQGKIGVGTAAPRAALDVAGEVKVGISSPALVCTNLTAGTMRYNSAQNRMEACLAVSSGWGWVPVGGTGTFQLARGIVRYKTKVDVSIFAVDGPEEAFAKHAETYSTSWGSSHALLGGKCNSAKGWHLTGCAIFAGGDDGDAVIFADGEGCGTNEGGETDVSIICIKQN